ncbi:MAG: hypothetical protein BMS9Abin15_0767 [Gammaproteobacteria bacterium]|nr:MAG: hypothetical protein BMS9Abin15_0767 [Gammaproteobacteria bacterium]
MTGPITKRNSVLQKAWRQFCRAVVRAYYRNCEIEGMSNLPDQGPVLLCANHANALADAVIIQAAINRTVHPLSRSGLFKNPLLRPILHILQAVPVYRRQDANSNPANNVDSFAKCYELFGNGGLLLIFPEGQSHSDTSLRAIKTGAARLALNAMEHDATPTVLPIGLNFSQKGSFRSNVLIKLGTAIDLSGFTGGDQEDDVRQLTSDIQAGLDSVTISIEHGDDAELLHRIERFFSMRHGKYRRRSMELRFRALKRLHQSHDELRKHVPEQILKVKRHLQQFERLCRNWGIRDYHLTTNYSPTIITRFIFRSLMILLLVLPLASWGIVNSIVPFLITRHAARWVSQDTDQYDTAKIVMGLFLFPLFWSGQVAWVYFNLDFTLAIYYALSLPPAAAAAVFIRKERQRIWDNLRVFFLFLRKRKLRRYLTNKRNQIERELAQLVRTSRKYR